MNRSNLTVSFILRAIIAFCAAGTIFDVFGVFSLPLIIVLAQKVDQCYEDLFVEQTSTKNNYWPTMMFSLFVAILIASVLIGLTKIVLVAFIIFATFGLTSDFSSIHHEGKKIVKDNLPLLGSGNDEDDCVIDDVLFEEMDGVTDIF